MVLELNAEKGHGLTVVGDAERIQQTLLHLVSNAVESYSGNPGTVFVRVGNLRLPAGVLADAHPPEPIEGGDYVFVEVRDQGFGMSPGTLVRVFEPFFTTKAPGRGLGLAACMGVAKAHGGFLTSHSELYRGSTFRIYLPFAHVQQETLIPESPVGAQTASCLSRSWSWTTSP